MEPPANAEPRLAFCKDFLHGVETHAGHYRKEHHLVEGRQDVAARSGVGVAYAVTTEGVQLERAAVLGGPRLLWVVQVNDVRHPPGAL